MGTRRFKNGNVYTGNYEDGRRQGQGKCFFANGGEALVFSNLYSSHDMSLTNVTHTHKIYIPVIGRMTPSKDLVDTITIMVTASRECFETECATEEASTN